MNILLHDFGGFPFIMDLARFLAEAGHRVTCVYANLLENPRGSIEENGDNLEVVQLNLGENYRASKSRLGRRFLHEVDYGRQAAKQISRINCDCVISSNTPTHAQYFILKACRRKGIPFIYWIQDFYSIAVGIHLRRKIPFAGRLLATAYETLEQRLLKQSDKLIPISHSFVPKLKEWSIDQNSINVIQNWAPVHKLPVLSKRNDWAKQHGLSDKFCFLYSGTLGLKHNPSMIHRLAREFKDDKDVRVVVVAEGTGVEELRRLNEKEPLSNLLLFPLQPESAYPEVLATGDVLFAILEENAGEFSVPSKILSYLCAGRPILLSAPSSNLASKIIQESESGYCADTANPDWFLKCARLLALSASSGALYYGDNARHYAESNFDKKKVLKQFEDLLEKVC